MLREIRNGSLEKHSFSLIGWRWRFVTGKRVSGASWSTGRARALLAAQADEPVDFMQDGRRTFWAHRGRFYWTDEDLEPRDVAALLHERELRAKRRLTRAHAMVAQDEQGALPRRERIPREVRRLVFERDGGRCVECGEAFDIQFDHVIPVSMGGATTPQNLQLLCAPCNQAKGASPA